MKNVRCCVACVRPQRNRESGMEAVGLIRRKQELWSMICSDVTDCRGEYVLRSSINDGFALSVRLVCGSHGKVIEYK